MRLRKTISDSGRIKKTGDIFSLRFFFIVNQFLYVQISLTITDN